MGRQILGELLSVRRSLSPLLPVQTEVDVVDATVYVSDTASRPDGPEDRCCPLTERDLLVREPDRLEFNVRFVAVSEREDEVRRAAARDSDIHRDLRIGA